MRKASGIRLRKHEKALRPVRPNLGIEIAYRAKIRALIDEMHKSFDYWIKAKYRANEPLIAQDASPAAQLRIELNRLGRQWQKRFNDAAPEMAEFFAQQSHRRSDRVLKDILKRAGWSVSMTMTPEIQEALRASVVENVALIRSIPQQYFTQIQGMVMRSVQAGRDLETLSKELRKQYGVTYRRAALIAKDQNNKSTAVIQRTRQQALGIEEGIWLHSHGGKKPRPTHYANHGKRFNIKEGWYDPDPRVRKKIWPEELINSRCCWKPIVEGLS